jgi:hypothetical protein
MVSRDEMQAAKARAQSMLKAYPTVLMAHYEPRLGQVIITLNTGFQFLLDPAKMKGLRGASRAALKDIEITGPGLGIYFPKLDVDVYIPSFLDGLSSTKSAAAQLGKAGGSAKTKEKAAAARDNGRLGGRPKRAPAKKTTKVSGKRG